MNMKMNVELVASVKVVYIQVFVVNFEHNDYFKVFNVIMSNVKVAIRVRPFTEK